MDSITPSTGTIVLPKLTGSQFCPHTEPRAGKQNFWSWIARCFPDSSHPGCQHFIKLFAGIMNDACDARDRNRMCPSDVPSPQSRMTFAPYSGDEVAAWWNEAVAMTPKELLWPAEPAAPPNPSQLTAAVESPPPESLVRDTSPPSALDDLFEFDPPVRRRKKSENLI